MIARLTPNQGDGRLRPQTDKGVMLRLRTKREGLTLAARADTIFHPIPLSR